MKYYLIENKPTKHGTDTQVIEKSDDFKDLKQKKEELSKHNLSNDYELITEAEYER